MSRLRSIVAVVLFFVLSIAVDCAARDIPLREDGKIKTKQGGKNESCVMRLGSAVGARQLVFSPLLPVLGGYAYRLRFDYRYRRSDSRKPGECLAVYLSFIGADGEHLSCCPLRPVIFTITGGSAAWRVADYPFYLPTGARKLRVTMRLRGQGSFECRMPMLTEIGRVVVGKSRMPHLLFQEDFESLPAIFANGGTLTWPMSCVSNGDLQIVTGISGQALHMKNRKKSSCAIRYDTPGRINVKEGCIEFWLKVVYNSTAVYDIRSLMPVAIWGIGYEGQHTDRIEIFCGREGKKVVGVRFSGASSGKSVYFGTQAGEWHHVALNWKVGACGNTGEFAFYLDGKMVIAEPEIELNFSQAKVKRGGKGIKFYIGSTFKPGNGEAMMIDRLRIWDRNLKIVSSK